MNFTFNDMGILVSMSIIIIFMSLTFPQIGLAGNTFNDSDVPTFNMTANNLDMIGDFPENPGTPSQGTLIHYANKSGGGDRDEVWVSGSTQGGLNLALLNFGTGLNPDTEIRQNFWSNGVVTVDNQTFNSEGDTFTIQNNSWIVDYEVLTYDNAGFTNFTTSVQWTIREGPNDSSFIDSIPIIGGIINGAAQIAQGLMYVASIFYWVTLTLFEIVINLIIILLNVFTFLISLLHFLLSNYFAVINGAAGFGSLVLLIPGIVLFLEFAKLGMVAISLLPTT